MHLWYFRYFLFRYLCGRTYIKLEVYNFGRCVLIWPVTQLLSSFRISCQYQYCPVSVLTCSYIFHSHVTLYLKSQSLNITPLCSSLSRCEDFLWRHACTILLSVLKHQSRNNVLKFQFTDCQCKQNVQRRKVFCCYQYFILLLFSGDTKKS